MPDPYLQTRRLARLVVSSPRGTCERSHAIRSSSCQQAIATRSAYYGKPMSGCGATARSRRMATNALGKNRRPVHAGDVGYRGKSGKHLLSASISRFDPNVWSGRAVQEASSTWLMRSCINVSGLWLERVVLRATMDISAHASSLPDRPRSRPFGSPVFACAGKTDPPSRSSSRRPRRVNLSYVIDCCSLLRSVPLFVPCGRSFVPAYDRQSRRAEERSRPAVALSSRACSTAARPRLDGSEHGARIKPVGTLSQPSRCTRRRVLYGGPPRRCGRACWRAQSPARCGAIAFWPPRSRTSGHSAPTVLT
jgi:hypothetical protein